VSSVHRIFLRSDMKRLPANQKHRAQAKRWQRDEKPQPGHRLQIDVKFLERISGTGKRLYQFTAIDDCTRIRVLKVYDACNQGTSIRFVDEDGGDCCSASRSCRPTAGANSTRTLTGASRPWTSAISTSGREHRI